MRIAKGYRGRKVDANHRLIRETFERRGFSVLDLARLGRGVPDLLVRRGTDWFLVEVKAGTKQPKPLQKQFAERWPVIVVRTVEDVLAI